MCSKLQSTKEVAIVESSIRMIALIASLTLWFVVVLVTPFVWTITEESPLSYDFWIAWSVWSSFLILAVGSYVLAPQFIRRKLEMRPLYERHPEICTIVQKFSKTQGLEKIPRVYLVDSKEPRCFVFGRTSKDAKLVITEGLVKLVKPEELKASILHELSHIRNKDMSFMTWGLAFAKAVKYWYVVLICVNLALRFVLGTYSFTLEETLDLISYHLFNILVFVILPILTINSVSRVREFLADARASLILRKSSDIISAIKKVSEEHVVMSLLRTSGSNIAQRISGFVPHSLKKYTVMRHPSLATRIHALREEKYLTMKGKLLLPTVETAIYAGVLAFYFLFGAHLITAIASAIAGVDLYEIVPLYDYILYASPALIISLLNSFAIKRSDLRTLYVFRAEPNSFRSLLKARVNVSYFWGLAVRNVVSYVTLSILSFYLFVFLGEFSIGGMLYIFFMSGVCFLVSTVFSFVYALLRSYSMIGITRSPK